MAWFIPLINLAYTGCFRLIFDAFVLFFLSREMRNLRLTDDGCLLARWSACFDYEVAAHISSFASSHWKKKTCHCSKANILTVVHIFHSIIHHADRNRHTPFFYFYYMQISEHYSWQGPYLNKTLHRNSLRNMLKSPQLWVGLWTPQIPIQSMFHGMWWRHGQREVHQAERKRSQWPPSCSTGSAKWSPAHFTF